MVCKHNVVTLSYLLFNEWLSHQYTMTSLCKDGIIWGKVNNFVSDWTGTPTHFFISQKSASKQQFQPSITAILGNQ